MENMPLDSEVEAAALEQKIASERTRVGQLRATERRIEELEVLTPAHRLPVEIMCEIFFQTPQTRSLAGKTVETAPWRLGHVCQSWRAIALANTRLWSSITMASSETATETCPAEMVEIQLLRSGTSALTVTIDCQEGEVKDDLRNSIELCVAHSNRWATLRLILQPGPLLAARILPLLRPVKGRLDTLLRLEFVSDSSTYFPSDTFSITPHLRDVTIPAAGYYLSLLSFDHLRLPFSQLTRFRGALRSQGEALKVLKAAPKLVKFSISFHTEGGDNFDVVHPHLRYLSVHSVGDSDIRNHLTVPNLQGLWVWGDAVANLPRCVERSSCQLTTLVVHRCSEPNDLAQVLQFLPTLTTLFVEFAPGILSAKTRPLVDALRIRDGLVQVCPNLTHLAAGGPSAFGVTAFVEMAASRWYEATPSPLVFVRAFRVWDASTRARVPKAVVDCLRKMREEGLDAAFESQVDLSESFFGFKGP